MSEPDDTQSTEEKQPKIVLQDFDDDDAEMIEEILSDGGVKSEVIRRA